MKEPRILPFYMTYPMPIAYTEDNNMMRDLEYFQQLYPDGARLLQREVRNVLDIMDYEGSLIYDDYPDRFMLQKLARDIFEKLQKQSEDNSEQLNRLLMYSVVEEYIYLILLNEVYRRRHNSDRGYLQF